jgi:4'-phosphopantetheinyl transferase
VREHQVDLWSWRLTGGDHRLLAPDELARARRLARALDRDRFIAARARLRSILASYLGRPAHLLRFNYGAHGRPELDGIVFSLSHAGEVASLAVSGDLALGLDIEMMRPVPEVVIGSLAAGERLALMALPEPERAPAFLRVWTRKEAYLKGRGLGLVGNLTSFEVTSGAVPRVLYCASGESLHWQLHDLAIAPGISGALAVRAGGAPFRIVERLRLTQPRG